ncbi:deoxyuridine 5'-triphosphate nucleotidohydrolase [Candidatus Moduliflexus flocculans]|uniref:Deoxyuridine 5'-triphosphate nucleotidohydrolase n=1 Tax=Candidatus Moduliflexus flocculans TaxID=1499966 RepID=A0A081BSL6_9BACT|nr:deoxyuridine 5'-triphosphate nucleotidohydrolase [Candidatus Moduliflexus flocculans]
MLQFFVYFVCFVVKMTPMHVRIAKIHPDAIVPHYVHPGDSGMDVYSIEEVTIPPGATALVRTGLKIAVPEGYEAQVRPKSGLALKHAISLSNTPGTIDSGYRGEICVILINHGQQPYHVEKQSKIAQLVICPVIRAEILEVTELDDTARGEGGFGSTGLRHPDSSAAS